MAYLKKLEQSLIAKNPKPITGAPTVLYIISYTFPDLNPLGKHIKFASRTSSPSAHLAKDHSFLGILVIGPSGQSRSIKVAFSSFKFAVGKGLCCLSESNNS